MKDRKTFLLAGCFALSLTLYIVLFWIELDYLWFSNLKPTLLLSVHAIPAFCLQALLCRTAKWNWIKFIPLILLFLTACVGALYLFGVWGSGWDALGGGLLLIWCVAPAAGCCLGWMYAGHRRWVAAIGWALLLAVYVRLKERGGPLAIFDFEPPDLAALIVLIAGLYLLFRKTKQKNVGE